MKKKQQGMALLMVLLMMSLMAVIAVNINEHWMRSMVRGQSLQEQMKAKWLLLGGEIYAKKWLQNSLDKQNSVNLTQSWSSEDIAMRSEEGEVAIRLRSATECFNLNALAAEASPSEDASTLREEKKIFMLLLTNAGVPQGQAEEVANAIMLKFNGQGTDNYMIKDVSEVREIPGVSSALYLQIAPLLCAYGDTLLRLNINTVTAQHIPLLRAMLLNAISNEQAMTLLHSRPAEGWPSSEFLFTARYPEIEKLKESGIVDWLTTYSDYFIAEMSTVSEEHSYRLNTLLYYRMPTVTAMQRQFVWGGR